MNFWKNASIAYAAGALGGLANAVIFWVLVTYGITADINVTFNVPMHLQAFSQFALHQIIWGSIFAFLLLVPIFKSSWFKRGLILGLVPSLVMLLYVFPYVTHGGMFGLSHGNFAFVVVLVVNWIYSFIASIWYQSFT